ncbi:carbohydrate kinase [Coleofasciculus sp. H7-2]|uniref:carbohydrate kinase family protein n=1 Tax=Coleofasciculus sp. H7-2 TaxID=3351545 RepID=UPI003671DDF0
MTHPRVLCLGEILFDCLADQLGRSLADVESWTPYPGGAPANVACALVKLGTPSGFIGCVGQDQPGDQLVQLLQEVGVDSTGVQRHDTAPTRQVYVVRSLSGEREFAAFGVNATSAKETRDTREFADTHLQASALPEALFENADFLVVGSLELAYPDTRAAITKALELADRYNVKIVLDVNRRDMFWPDPSDSKPMIQELIKHVDFLKITDEEAEWLFETTDAGAIAYRLDSVEGVLVTAGEKGCAYCLGGNEDKVPAFSVKVVDTTGAGDGFLAGFIDQLCKHGIQHLADAEMAKRVVTYANAVGGITAMKPGAIAAQPTAAEVEDFLGRIKVEGIVDAGV